VGHQLTRPVSVSAAVRAGAALITPPAERGLELLLQQLLDERAHLGTHRTSSKGSNQSLPANGDGPDADAGVTVHGVGSFSILPIGTYATSANFHQPRDTTFGGPAKLCPSPEQFRW
jgi:hypothetical protein